MVDVIVADTYATMKGLSPTAGNAVFVTDKLKGGHFLCKAGTKPTDPKEGIYVSSNTSGYYYERERESDYGRPEWFGALQNDSTPATLSQTRDAIHACIAMVQTTLLNAVDYYVDDKITFDRSGSVLEGIAGSGRDRGLGVPTNGIGTAGGTRIILTGANVVSAPVFQFGKATPSAQDDSNLTRNSYVRNIVFARLCTASLRPNPSPNSDPVNCVKGVIMSGMNRCGIENCSSFDSPVGFHYFGVVASYSRDCDAARTTPASSSTNDFFVGHLAGGYQIYYGYIASNASLYLEHPTCYDDAVYNPATGAFGPSLFSLSLGIRLFGYVADTFVDGAEVGRVQIGIEVDGRDSSGVTVPLSSGPGAHQDVRLTSCVIDGTKITGLQLRNLNASGQISVDDIYIAAGAANGYGANVFSVDHGASIDFSSGRMLGTVGTGFNITNTSNVSIRGTYLRDYSSPVVLNGAITGIIEPRIFNSRQDSATAIVATACHRMSYRPQIDGADNVFAYGISMVDTSYCNGVDGSSINPGCFNVVDAARKVIYGGGDARSSSAFSATANVLIGATS